MRLEYFLVIVRLTAHGAFVDSFGDFVLCLVACENTVSVGLVFTKGALKGLLTRVGKHVSFKSRRDLKALVSNVALVGKTARMGRQVVLL